MVAARQGLGGGGRGRVRVYGAQFPLEKDANVLELDGKNGCTTA